ncbi:MAG: type III-B CRISPR module RAMP protein Cmr4 [Caldisphaeraceae archaeon]|nr:type III-B CRISPR module RAMP protein Cmr4 [Caldisphaeraceae archaeon]MEB3797259.1 type III-B CRISPR module RAMP protein Cmr4 [Caldisphaeraceae archaeon]
MGIEGSIIFAYSLTPVHAGMGRSPSVVDLPVQRDNLGYPIIFSSSFKGALKSYFKFNSNKNDKFECLFGSEPEDSVSKTSFLIFTDLVPFAYPVPVIEDGDGSEGYAYVTTEYLYYRIKDIIDAFSHEPLNINVDHSNKDEISVLINPSIKTLGYINVAEEMKLGAIIKSYKKGKIFVLPNDIGKEVIESSLIRYTRNKLDRESKRSENLWTEEYIPQGTLFIGGVSTRYASSENNCTINDFKDEINEKYIFVGGKETIGKGLIKIKVLQKDNRGGSK